MFGLNQPAQIASVITGAYANPVEEFRARVEAMTPQVFIRNFHFGFRVR
jgi:hypothetical protein